MAVTDWSTTAASNTSIGGIGIQGTNLPSNFDNALRELMAQVATFITGATFTATGTPITLVSTDAGAAAGPTLTLYRNSATPAASDIMGQVLFQGEDSAGNTQDYAAIDAQIDDATSTSEDATLRLRTVVAGTMTTSLSLTGTTALMTSTDAGAAAAPVLDLYRDSATPAANDVLGEIQFNGEDSAGNKQTYASFAGIIDDATSTSEDGAVLFKAVSAGTLSDALSVFAGALQVNGGGTTPKIRTDGDDNELIIQGGNTASQGGSVHCFGDGHASAANDIWLVSDTTTVYLWDNSANAHMWAQTSTGAPGSGNNTVGMGFSNTSGALAINTSASHVIGKTADGTVAVINSGGSAQGTIAISGATTSYNAFFGSHWAQLADGSKRDILRGTICESLDQMSTWPEQGDDDRLPRFKISNTPGSKAVYGVFAWWDDFEADITNDALIGGLGAFVVRMAKGQTVQRGDYVESNGDGCGRVQADDILRASTVAKVTSATVVETYPDGSFLVPCTLHCG